MDDSKGTSARRSSGEKAISHPRFARFYIWVSNRPPVRRTEDPLRQELVGQASGIVLEVGAGGGQNFPFYDPKRVVRLEATEPDETMQAAAQSRLSQVPVPITLTKAAADALPFPDNHFDSAVATLVFCSVSEPELGLREILRVLKPGGSLLLLEHVRAQGRVASWIQDALVPVTTRISGNCHWNRDTETVVRSAGFQLTQVKQLRSGLLPVLSLSALRPA